MRANHWSIVVGLGLCATVACGGSTPKAEDASSATEPSKASAPSDTPPSDDKSTDDKSTDDKKSDAASSDASKGDSAPTRTAKDLITKPDVLYVYSYPDSDPHQVAEKKCAAKAKDDPKKKADCMSHAASNSERDAYSFQVDGDGKLWWLTIDRHGGHLITVHKLEFTVGDDSADKVTIKPHGPDKGTKPGGFPSELVIEVPTDSEIAITDPKLGKLVYQAQLGILGKQDR
jgi:hypothetical protein